MKEEGFTLLEMLTVCCVLALVAALSLPVLRVTERRRLESEAALLASDFRYLQEVSRTVDEEGGWQERPKLVVEAHGYYFFLPGTPGKQLVHVFPADVYAVPSAMSAQRAAIYYFHSSGDPGGVSALGHTVELQSPHYSLDVIIDEAGRVRTEGRHL